MLLEAKVIYSERLWRGGVFGTPRCFFGQANMLNMINDAILLSRPLRWLFWLIVVIVLLISAWLYYAAV